MPNQASPFPAMDREFLGIRCRLVDMAAALDRIDRTGEPTANDPRVAKIRQSLEILLTNAPDRAEKIQMAFSLPTDQ